MPWMQKTVLLLHAGHTEVVQALLVHRAAVERRGGGMRQLMMVNPWSVDG